MDVTGVVAAVEDLWGLDTVGWFVLVDGPVERRDIEPVLFAPPDFSGAIRNQTVDQGYAGTELAAFDDIGPWCIAGHEDVGFESGACSVGG